MYLKIAKPKTDSQSLRTQFTSKKVPSEKYKKIYNNIIISNGKRNDIFQENDDDDIYKAKIHKAICICIS
jgi:hypothetical protein